MFDRTRPSSSQSGIGSGSGTATSERSHKPDETPSASTIAGSPPSTGCDNAAASQLRQPRAKSLLTIIAQCCSFASIIFMILVLVGNTRKVKALTNIYFLSIDVSNVIPRSYPNAVLVNSIAQTLGLRGFYQVGLWNHCEGYPNEGVTYCAPTKSMYSFDPVTILLSQLLEGATSKTSLTRTLL
ncbi:Similar to Uncharacterized protein C15A10.09c; acc. no. O13729 [Pyronema omphalodes CBS 100304]|uniref:Similar to Uncharacterized protein C15A10.09c acc. no. O13729 n=1 Tax=Pyronema omphalodes (strain CBS 100304) TaxID=1076935 RepID=U4LYK7_PYROM|nr:Similar to Uncharacterized protein C15A10.09c; acc. no. O13729 [Pyronema omphalodes CBS 100304]